MVYQAPLPPEYAERNDEELIARIAAARQRLGPRLVILGHHYQRDEVIAFADFTGDSLKLSQIAAQQTQADYIVFCGVHFMAETADILTGPRQQVILPDLSAGCSMADMADIDQLEEAWGILEEHAGAPITPITYVNSTAAIKAFVGRHDGACCTSSNAKMVLEWALRGAEPGGGPHAGHKVLFLPDQHLGRNTAYALGWPLDSMVVYDPNVVYGGLLPEELRAARIVLWPGTARCISFSRSSRFGRCARPASRGTSLCTPSARGRSASRRTTSAARSTSSRPCMRRRRGAAGRSARKYTWLGG